MPRIVLLLDFDDANSLVSGVLDLKGCRVYKSTTADDCLAILKRLEGKVDAILIKDELVVDGNFTLVANVRKFAPEVMIIGLANKTDEKEKLSECGIDELVLTPMSAENLADKILMMLARRELKRERKKSTWHR
ncbi:MAG TPA: hypothetical protein VF884_12590 [Nitrososphaeraceae archaeon]